MFPNFKLHKAAPRIALCVLDNVSLYHLRDSIELAIPFLTRQDQGQVGAYGLVQGLLIIVARTARLFDLLWLRMGCCQRKF